MSLRRAERHRAAGEEVPASSRGQPEIRSHSAAVADDKESAGGPARVVTEDGAVQAELLAATRRGSPDALSALYERHGESVYDVAFRLTESSADAQDVVQEVFLGLPEALVTFDGRGSLEGWLRRVAVRTALLKLRRVRRRRETHLSLNRVPAAPARHIDRIELERALSQLPEALRVVLVLKEIEGFSHREIGDLLGIRPSASAVRLSRARQQLRNLLT